MVYPGYQFIGFAATEKQVAVQSSRDLLDQVIWSEETR